MLMTSSSSIVTSVEALDITITSEVVVVVVVVVFVNVGIGEGGRGVTGRDRTDSSDGGFTLVGEVRKGNDVNTQKRLYIKELERILPALAPSRSFTFYRSCRAGD